METNTTKTSGNHRAQITLRKKMGIVIEIVMVFAIPAMFIWLGLKWVGNSQFAQQGVVWLANIIMMVLVLMVLRRRGTDFREIGLILKRTNLKKVLKAWPRSLVVFAITLMAFLIGSAVGGAIFGAQVQTDVSGYDYLKDNFGVFILSLLGVYIVSSFGEELVYRGYLIHRISGLFDTTKYSNWIAVLLSAVIFGFAHFQWGPIGIVQTFFVGLALAMSYLYLRRNLWTVVLAHLYMDTLLFLNIYFS